MCPQTIGTTGHAESDMHEGWFCATLFQAARKSLILNGEMSEWLKEHAWKACVGETLPWVRIPLSPPSLLGTCKIFGCQRLRRPDLSAADRRAATRDRRSPRTREVRDFRSSNPTQLLRGAATRYRRGSSTSRQRIYFQQLRALGAGAVGPVAGAPRAGRPITGSSSGLAPRPRPPRPGGVHPSHAGPFCTMRVSALTV